MKRFLVLIVVFTLMGCVAPVPTPLPTITPTIVSPIAVSPLATPTPQPTITPVPIAQRSKVSVMIGARPQGLADFLDIAHPTVIYSINNAVYDTIRLHSPDTILIRRIQNDIWDRLPDQMYKGLGTTHWEIDARASARYEALGKKMYVPGRGLMNYVQFIQLSRQDFIAPMNEPVLGDRGDYIDKAKWLNAWFEEWLTIIHQYGLHGSIFSFPTGEPAPAAVPYLVGAARIAAQHGDIIDVHEYGVNDGMLNFDDPENGALGFVRFYNALPTDARPRFVVSEFGAGNGYDTVLHGTAWISDSIGYGFELRRYPYLIGATAFQLDLGAESNIPESVLDTYAFAATQINWLWSYSYLPVVTKN